MTKNYNRKSVLALLKSLYNIEELKTLRFNLGIDKDYFRNKEINTQSSYAQEIIKYCERNLVLNDLKKQLIEDRPQAEKAINRAFGESQAATGSRKVSAGTKNFIILGLILFVLLALAIFIILPLLDQTNDEVPPTVELAAYPAATSTQTATQPPSSTPASPTSSTEPTETVEPATPTPNLTQQAADATRVQGTIIAFRETQAAEELARETPIPSTEKARPAATVETSLILREPPDQAGSDNCFGGNVPLSWDWNGELRNDGPLGGEYFAVRFGLASEGAHSIVWTKDRSYIIDFYSEVLAIQTGEMYEWNVAVVAPYAEPLSKNWHLIDQSANRYINFCGGSEPTETVVTILPTPTPTNTYTPTPSKTPLPPPTNTPGSGSNMTATPTPAPLP